MAAKKKEIKEEKVKAVASEEQKDAPAVSKGPVCPFCQGGVAPTYKNWEGLNKFVSDRGKILSRSRTGVCAKHQRDLARAVKRARHLALLPFVLSAR